MSDKWRSFSFFSQRERAEFIALSMVIGIGRTTLRRLIYLRIKHELSFAQVLGARSLHNFEFANIKKFDFLTKNSNIDHLIDSNFSLIQRAGVQPITYFDSLYPELLKTTADPPMVLFYKGDSQLLKTNRWLAVVGSRRMTPYGNQATDFLVGEIVERKWGIVSGAMYGIDQAAHQSCIKNGGKTIGVLGFGHNAKVSVSTRRLLEQILDSGGGLISEFSPHTPAQAGHFPLRNRIVAGMSHGVVVIEAAAKSGSHITAQCALDEGRLVGAVPGPIMSAYSEGTKFLIKQGALCVSSAADIFSELEPCIELKTETSSLRKNIKKTRMSLTDNSLERKIYDMLLAQPSTISNLSSGLSISVAKIAATLTKMEIEGLIVRADTMWRIVL